MKYKFFEGKNLTGDGRQLYTEAEIVQALRKHKSGHLQVDATFNFKIQDAVHSILSELQRLFKKKEKKNDKSKLQKEHEAQFQFQILDLRFAIKSQEP